ncbi:polysaccharide deacetylase family protein [Vampirovibrio sp.]|uniref:polysaccharide deacetylase family protein n=1 Tax=Vampirovibrio sp. TaxID=2717857 RepID=UPI0035945877
MLIFNFHHIEKHLLHPERKHISMSPQGLSRFIRTLRLLGMRIVSMQEVLAATPDAINDHRSVLLTFDDGYTNNLLEALPVLEAEQCPATVFVLPGRYGGTNEWDQGHLPESQRDQLMSLAQMERMAASPLITLGSHGLYHRDFPTLAESDMVAELSESYQMLHQTFGENFLPVFAYPWGHYGPREVEALSQSPYQAAFTVETRPWRSTDNIYQIPRFSAFYRDGNPLVLLAKLARHNLLFA